MLIEWTEFVSFCGCINTREQQSNTEAGFGSVGAAYLWTHSGQFGPRDAVVRKHRCTRMCVNGEARITFQSVLVCEY